MASKSRFSATVGGSKVTTRSAFGSSQDFEDPKPIESANGCSGDVVKYRGRGRGSSSASYRRRISAVTSAKVIGAGTSRRSATTRNALINCFTKGVEGDPSDDGESCPSSSTLV